MNKGNCEKCKAELNWKKNPLEFNYPLRMKGNWHGKIEIKNYCATQTCLQQNHDVINKNDSLPVQEHLFVFLIERGDRWQVINEVDSCGGQLFVGNH